MYWTLLVLVLSFLLLTFLLWKEYRRPNRAWLAVRIMASSLAVISLVLLALPVHITQKKSVSGASVVLLTKGFHADTVQQLIRQNRIGKVYTADKGINAFGAEYLPSFQKIKEGLSVHVVGEGLTGHELKNLSGATISFHPAEIKNNFLSVGWNQNLASGEPLVVQGRFANSSSSAVKIILSGFGVNLDSVMLEANRSSFQLTATPSHIDKAVYSITAMNGKDTITSEPIPVAVHSTEPLNVLVLASSPDFENKFLKNWLAENNYRFAVRTTISANKYDKEYVNLSSTSLDRITPALLEKFDLVLTDMSALSKLPSADLANLRSAVSSTGLGLVIKADSTTNSSAFYASSFPLVQTRDSIQHLVKLSFANTAYTSSPVKVEQPVYIKNVIGTQPLAHDQQMRIVANSSLLGLGKLVVTTIPNTYLWQLSGNTKDYTTYWTKLLTKAARKKTLENVWTLSPHMPVVDEETHLQLQSTNENLPNINVGESKVYMEQDRYLPYRWTASYWPRKAGWQTITNTDASSDWFYVYDKDDWSGIKAVNKIAATKRYAALHSRATVESRDKLTEVQTEIPGIYFFILFIICCGLLWFEKKLHDQ